MPKTAAKAPRKKRQRGDRHVRQGEPTTAKAKAPGERRPTLMDVPGVASDIVQRAAAILGDEIAAGIVAAKQVEGRFVKPGEVKEQAPQEMMQRFRKDAHEVVDIMMDLLTSITDTLGSLVDQANGAAAAGTAAASPANGGNGAIRVRIGAGETGRRSISIGSFDGSGEAAPIFACTDFVAGSGDRLPASCVSFDTKGDAAATGADGKVEVIVEVPDGMPVGVYSGLVRWGRNGKHRTVMELLVDRDL